jgi:integrase/recombinase XerC
VELDTSPIGHQLATLPFIDTTEGVALPGTTLGPIVLRYIGDRVRRGELDPKHCRGPRNHLYSFALSFGKRPLDQLGGRAVERWLEELHTRGLAASTRAAHLSSLRTFARWCVLHDIVPRDWTLAAPKVKRPRAIPRDMNGDHFHATLAVAPDARQRVIVWLMYGAGLRCIEVSRLDVDDWDRVTGCLFVTGKGGHQREVPVGAPLRRELDAYLTWSGHTTGPLVARLDGRSGRLGPERISGIVGKLVRKAGVKVRNGDGRGAHGFRACAASDMLDVEPNAWTVAEFLGHADLSSLRPYIRRRKLQEVREAVERRFAA